MSALAFKIFSSANLQITVKKKAKHIAELQRAKYDSNQIKVCIRLIKQKNMYQQYCGTNLEQYQIFA